MVTVVICATPLWNESISWNTRDPYFSDCFKNLILVIASCSVLWIVAPLEFIKICRYQGSPSPWTKLSIAKITLKALLLVTCSVELVKETYAYVAGMKTGLDGLLAAIAYLITIILTVIITMMCKKRGLRSSFALPSFWMISTIATLISIYDDIQEVDLNDWVSVTSLVDDSSCFVISLIQLVLSCIADKEMRTTGRQFTKYCPLEGSGFPSILTFSWLLKLIAKSADNSLHQNYLIPQCHELKSAAVVRTFNRIWKDNFRGNTAQGSAAGETTRLLTNEITQAPERKATSNHAYQRKTSLFKALMKTSKKYLIISSVLEIILTALYFLPTYLLSLILSSGKEPEWHKYLFATTLFIVLLLCSFADSQRKYFGLVAALRIKTAVMNAVFEKALVSQEIQDVKEHLYEDAENIFQMVCLATEVWGAPLRLLIGFYLLYLFLGPACFAGFVTAALLIPLNVMIAGTADNFQTKNTDVRKDRLNVLSEILHGMKVLKIYAWEKFFLDKLLSFRKSELKPLRIAMFLKMSFKFLVLSSTSLVALTTFLVYVLMESSVDGRMIFIYFSLICLLKTPFTSLLRLFAYFVQGMASMSRIQSFLEAKEMEDLPTAEGSGCEILLEDASFTFAGSETPYLKNLNLKARDTYLIAVMGDSPSGKSSFLRALLGQMENVTGIAQIEGEIAFVGDSAWIQNTTLERNILFVKPKEDRFYRKTLEVCGLMQDIEVLPEGEETEIGEKGYQLNEDQKLKVDLARAIYQDADIYLLDDPLRCSDATIAEHLYYRVIGHSGILNKKVRIFTTTDETFLPLVDQIIFLRDGRIVERGKYSELIGRNGFCAKYLRKMSHSYISGSKNRRKAPKSNFNFTDNIKDHCDPWYSASGLYFKPEVESLMHGETDSPKGLFRKLLGFIKMNGYMLTIATIFLAIIANCSEAAGWVWWTQWNHENTNSHKVYKSIYIYASLIFIQVVCTALCGVLIYAGATFAIQSLYCWSLNRIMRAPRSTFGSIFIEKVSRSFDKDLQYADEQIPLVFFIWLIAVMKAPVLLMVIFIKSPLLCVFSAPLILAFCVVLKLYMNAWQQLHRLTAATRCPLSNLLKEILQGMTNIRAYKASSHFITRFQIKLDTYNNCYLLFLLVSRWLSSSIEIIGSFFVLLAASAILSDEPNGDNFVGIFIVFAMEISESLTAVTYMSSLLDVDLSAIERFQSFAQVKKEAEWENPASDLSDLWPSSGCVSIQNLSTPSYGEGLYPVLTDVTLSVRHGEKVAIVGKEEAGIYTILDSLFRIREISEGQIFIDKIDISSIGLHNLRSRLAFIPQDHFVFHGTVRENLDPNKEHQDEELRSVIRTVRLSAHFTDLSDVVGDEISLEDKFRFSLARCVLKNPKLLIMDKPEKLWYRQLFHDCTFLTFGENQVLDTYDRVIRISSGEIVEDVRPKRSASFRY